MGIGAHKGERQTATTANPDDESSASGDALPGGAAAGKHATFEPTNPAGAVAMDPTTAYVQEETFRIKSLVSAISSRGHDVNIVITAPVCIGTDVICQEFVRKATGFRFAGIKNQHEVSQQVITALDACDSLRKTALEALSTRLADQGVYAPPRKVEHQHELIASTSVPTIGSKKGSRILQADDQAAPRHNSDSSISSIATALFLAEIRRCTECLRASGKRAPRNAGETPRVTAANRTAAASPIQPLNTQKLRVFSGSILDATNVPMIANNEFRLLDKWALTSLEQMGELAWREFTEQCPAHSTLYVYLHFDDKSYATIYDKYRKSRDSNVKAMLDNLQAFWTAQKRASDSLYHSGANTVVTRYYVMVLNCFNLELTSLCTQLFIINQILNTVDDIQLEKLWGHQSNETDRKAFINSTDWLRKRYKTVPETIISPNASWRVPERRRSLDDGSRPTKLVLNDPKTTRVRRGSFDGSSISSGSSSSSSSSSSGHQPPCGVTGLILPING